MKPSRADLAQAENLFRTSGWLSRTASDFQDALLSDCHWQWFAAGEAISHGGDTSGGIFGLARGSIAIISALGAADVPILHITGAPFWYGANPLLDNAPRIVTVVARSRSLVARVPRHILAALLDESPGRWRFIAQQMADIGILTMVIATDLLIRDSRRRCIAVLLRVAGCRTGEEVTAIAAVSQDDLAAMANLTRQTVGPILNELAAAGLVTVGYRSIVLHDAQTLREMVLI